VRACTTSCPAAGRLQRASAQQVSLLRVTFASVMSVSFTRIDQQLLLLLLVFMSACGSSASSQAVHSASCHHAVPYCVHACAFNDKALEHAQPCMGA